MAILMTNVLAGMPATVYDQTIADLSELLRAADGFRGHFAGSTPDGNWSVIEIWDTAEQWATFFDAHVRPHVPPGNDPQIRELHHILLA
jgi:hypothetical protein